jgi:gluconokinase
VGVAESLEAGLDLLAPGTLDPTPGHDETVVAAEASSAAYRTARISAAARLRDLAAAADLLAGPRDHQLSQQSGNKRQLVVEGDPGALHW